MAETWRQFVRNCIEPQSRLVFGCPLDEPGLLDYCPQALRVRCSDERTAGYAAYGFSHATRKVSFLCLESGPSFTHAISSIVEAASAHLPMVIVISAAVEQRRNLGAFQDLDIDRILSAFNVKVYTVHHLDCALDALESCTKEAEVTNQPVAIIFRTLVGSALEEGSIGSRRWSQKSQNSAWGYSVREESASVIIDKLTAQDSKRISNVMIIGSGARKSDLSSYEITTAAHAWNARVFVTASGRGIVDEHMEQFAGLAGLYATPKGIETLNTADRIIVLGSALEETVRERWAPKSDCELIIINTECVDIPEHDGPRINVQVDLTDFIRAAISKNFDYTMRSSSRDPVSSMAPQIAHVWRQIESWVIATNAKVVCFENGLCDLWGYDSRWFALPPGRTTVVCAEQSGMGVGLCGSLGAAASGELVVAVCGDATLRMNLSALTDCAERQLPLLLIVLCNDAMGWPDVSRKELNSLAQFPWNEKLPSLLMMMGFTVHDLRKDGTYPAFDPQLDAPTAVFVNTVGTVEPWSVVLAGDTKS